MRVLMAAVLLLSTYFVQAQVTINPCITNKPVTIVVLGSSTSAGTGASHIDSSWVRKYTAALQQVNPSNQVINLGVGGFTTYRIMPDNFVTPTGRPPVNTAKNITKALSYNPDAIIVNLPSNDRQWPMNEQLANFDSLYSHSWNNGVPLYVCTTQPIAGSGAYQAAVKDSIIAKFSPYVLDFFTPLADTNNLIIPNYAADAVHLNDTGHNILFNQAFNKDILADIFDGGALPDLSVIDILLPPNKCQDSLAQVGVVVVNYGDTASAGITAALQVFTATDTVNRPIPSTTAILPCQLDTFWRNMPLYAPGNYAVRATIIHLQDTNLSNNVLEKQYRVFAEPNLQATADTLCLASQTQFSLPGVQADTILWYANINDTAALQSVGVNFTLQKDTSLFAQAVNGNLRFSSTLTASETANINFNGNMFNLVATQNSVLDSVAIRFQSTGTLPVRIYTKQGAYQGFENTPAAWTLLRTDTVQITNPNDAAFLDLSGISISATDTQAIYLHMASSAAQLRYQSGTMPTVKQGAGLTYLSGIGITYNFGSSIYQHRAIAANFYYQYGFNPLGDCATNRLEIAKVISKENVALGPDTTMGYMGKTLQVSAAFTNPVWVNANTQDTLAQTNMCFVDTTQTDANNQATIVCFATDKWGCQTTDTIVLTYVPNFGFDDLQSSTFRAFPNPFTEQFTIEFSVAAEFVAVYNALGEQVLAKPVAATREIISTANWASGVYIIHVQTNQGEIVKRVVKR